MPEVQWGIVLAGVVPLMLCAGQAQAQNRSRCADPPMGETAMCGLSAGEASLEVVAVAFDLVHDPLARTQSLSFGDVLLRAGIAPATEFQLGFATLVDATAIDRASGAGERSRAFGDSYAAIRHGVSQSASLELYATLPTGAGASGAGTWGTGVLLQIDLPAPEGQAFWLVPELAAAPNASGSGRHFLMGLAAGMARSLAPQVIAGMEIALHHDDDPAGPASAATVTGSLAWQFDPRLQLLVEAGLGVAHGEPRASALVGFAFSL